MLNIREHLYKNERRPEQNIEFTAPKARTLSFKITDKNCNKVINSYSINPSDVHVSHIEAKILILSKNITC